MINHKPILVGSRAISMHMPNFRLSLDNSDADFVVTTSDETPIADFAKGDIRIEKTVDSVFYADILSRGGWTEYKDFILPSLLMLYAMKVSSLKHCNETWWKHYHDVQILNIVYGFNQAMVYANGMLQACDEHSMKHNKNAKAKERLTFDMPDKEFFDNSKNVRIVEHDNLHALLSYPNMPLYKKYLKDSDRPLVDMDRLQDADIHDKIRMFMEEACVIATERFIIPSDFKVSGFEAVCLAIPLLFSRLTKGTYCNMMLSILENVGIYRFFSFVPEDFLMPRRGVEFWDQVAKITSKETHLKDVEILDDVGGPSTEAVDIRSGDWGPWEYTSWVEPRGATKDMPQRVLFVDNPNNEVYRVFVTDVALVEKIVFDFA